MSSGHRVCLKPGDERSIRELSDDPARRTGQKKQLPMDHHHWLPEEPPVMAPTERRFSNVVLFLVVVVSVVFSIYERCATSEIRRVYHMLFVSTTGK